MWLILVALLLSGPVTLAAQIPYKSYNQWHVMRTVPDELHDAAQTVAYTKLTGVDRPEYEFVVGVAQLGVSCPDDQLVVFAMVPGVHQPANVRFWVDQHPASELALWQGIVDRQSFPTTSVMVPPGLVRSFMTQSRLGSVLRLEVNDAVFRYSLNGFTAATGELPCTSW